jgi:hypothetical protein
MTDSAKEAISKAGKSVNKTYKKARDHFDKEVDVSKLKDETLNDMAKAVHKGKIYDDKGVLKRKSKLHRAAETVEKHPKTAALAGLGVGAGIVSRDDDEDDIMEEIKRKIRDDEPLSATEKRLLRLMEE